MAGYRKRKRTNNKRKPRRKAPYRRKRRRYNNGSKKFIAGKNRTSGYYGRFNGPNAELKFHDVDLNDAAVSTTSEVIASINLIPQGVTEKTRVGRKCTITSIQWRWRISMFEEDAESLPAAPDEIRIILFLDKQCNGATASTLDLIETDGLRSYRNLANSERFVFFLDQVLQPPVPTVPFPTTDP